MSAIANVKLRVRALEILLEVRMIDRFDVPQRRDAARRKYLECSDLRLSNSEEFLLAYEKYLRGKQDENN